MSVGTGKEGVGRAVRLGGSRGCRAAQEDPFGDCSERPRTGRAGAGGCRSLRGRAGQQATGTGRMDLDALLLTTGPNASNTSDSPDNLTSAGEQGQSGASLLCAGGGKGEGFTSEPNCLGNFITVLYYKICSLLCSAGKGGRGRGRQGQRGWSQGAFRSGRGWWPAAKAG